MGKESKKDKKAAAVDMDTGADGETEEVSYETRLQAVNAVAHPLASKKLNKKLLKVVKKAAKGKSVMRGVKEVVKGLRKGNKGVVVIAGDISPIDVITHVPVLCEDSNVPYIYVPSKEDLGSAGATKRPTSCILIVPKAGADYKDVYDEILKEVGDLNKKLITTV
ncbi:50S ribosomal protein L30e-like protein [Entophlyctis helioformis]|nr:50S ribosomal protein L30e-like protein [Entophlyctis helioformis]